MPKVPPTSTMWATPLTLHRPAAIQSPSLRSYRCFQWSPHRPQYKSAFKRANPPLLQRLSPTCQIRATTSGSSLNSLSLSLAGPRVRFVGTLSPIRPRYRNFPLQPQSALQPTPRPRSQARATHTLSSTTLLMSAGGDT